jgi:hypothetical protein
MKRTLLLAIFLLVPLSLVVMKTMGQGKTSHASAGAEKWEYLVLSGPSSTNFEPTGNPDMRKQDGSFAREGFVLESQLDKAGANGWELVSVVGAPQNPVYYFKRRK